MTGNRETARRPEDLVTGIAIPKTADGARGGFVKLGARKYLVISIAMAAAVVEPDKQRRVAGMRVAVGACSAVAQRLPELEAALAGRPCDSMLGEMVRPEHLSPLSPIDDIRGSGAYRMEAALILVRRVLEHVGTSLEASA